MSQASGQSHQVLVEQLTEAVNEHEVKHLERFLEDNAQKTVNSKVVYKNIQEAQDYYNKEQQSKTSTQWKVDKFENDDSKSNISHAYVSHENKTQKVTYTFGPSGKIQRIDLA